MNPAEACNNMAPNWMDWLMTYGSRTARGVLVMDGGRGGVGKQSKSFHVLYCAGLAARISARHDVSKFDSTSDAIWQIENTDILVCTLLV